MLVCDLNKSESGVALVVASGYKAGLVFASLPHGSRHHGKLALSVDWLVRNWDKWFVYTYQGGPVSMKDAAVLRWNERRTIEAENANRRPA